MMKRLPCTMFFLVALFMFFTYEKKNTESNGKVPVLSTAEVTHILARSATCGDTITSDGGSKVTARGVCWSTGQTPTVKDYKTNDGTGEGWTGSNPVGGTKLKTQELVFNISVSSEITGDRHSICSKRPSIKVLCQSVMI